MIQTLSTVMQLFKGSYFSVAVGWRHLRPNSAIANGTTCVNYASLASKYKKSDLFKGPQINETFIIGTYNVDIDFNLEVIYQAWDAAFHHLMKHREESWKYGRSGVFLTIFKMFNLVMKHCIECLILLLKQNDFSRRN